MDWIDFVSLMKYMHETYGVPFGYSDETHEGEYPEFIADCDSAWFECPDCGEPIYWCDWEDHFLEYEDWKDNQFYCPICEAEWNADLEEEEE